MRWSVPGSNRRPPACKAGALPTELTPRVASVEARVGRLLRGRPPGAFLLELLEAAAEAPGLPPVVRCSRGGGGATRARGGRGAPAVVALVELALALGDSCSRAAIASLCSARSPRRAEKRLLGGAELVEARLDLREADRRPGRAGSRSRSATACSRASSCRSRCLELALARRAAPPRSAMPGRRAVRRGHRPPQVLAGGERTLALGERGGAGREPVASGVADRRQADGRLPCRPRRCHRGAQLVLALLNRGDARARAAASDPRARRAARRARDVPAATGSSLSGRFRGARHMVRRTGRVPCWDAAPPGI